MAPQAEQWARNSVKKKINFAGSLFFTVKSSATTLSRHSRRRQKILHTSCSESCSEVCDGLCNPVFLHLIHFKRSTCVSAIYNSDTPRNKNFHPKIFCSPQFSPSRSNQIIAFTKLLKMFDNQDKNSEWLLPVFNMKKKKKQPLH